MVNHDFIHTYCLEGTKSGNCHGKRQSMKQIGLLILLFILSLESLQGQKIDFQEYFRSIQGLTYNIDKFDSAYYMANEMLLQAETEEEKGLANYAKGMVIVKNGWGYYLGEYGVPYIEEAINHFAKVNDRVHLFDAFNTLAISYITIYNPENTITSARELEYLRLSLMVQQDSSFQIHLPFKANLKDENTQTEDILKTITVVEDNLRFATKNGEEKEIMYRIEKLGYLYWQLDKNLNRCEDYLLTAMNAAAKFGDRFFESICLSQLSVYANLAQDYRKGLKYSLDGLNHANLHNLGFRESIFRDQLYKSYLALGDTEKAIYHKVININIHEKLQQETQSKRHQLVVDRIKEMESRIALEQEYIRQKNRLRIYFILLWALLGLIGFAFYSNYRLRQKNKEIKSASLSGQTIERKRVAADLHDNLGSTISSIQWTMDTIDQTGLNERQLEIFKNLQGLLQKAYGDIRLLAHNLLPLSLEELGLAGSLKELVQKMNKNIYTKFTLSVGDNLRRFDSSIEFELYCISMELLNNIIHHAKATEAQIKLSENAHKLRLNISDNGIAYEPFSNDGMGLKNIKERVAAIGGTWQVKAGQNAGVINLIEVPVS